MEEKWRGGEISVGTPALQYKFNSNYSMYYNITLSFEVKVVVAKDPRQEKTQKKGRQEQERESCLKSSTMSEEQFEGMAKIYKRVVIGDTRDEE